MILKQLKAVLYGMLIICRNVGRKRTVQSSAVYPEVFPKLLV
jgi:uncharacterized protein Veg